MLVQPAEDAGSGSEREVIVVVIDEMLYTLTRVELAGIAAFGEFFLATHGHRLAAPFFKLADFCFDFG